MAVAGISDVEARLERALTAEEISLVPVLLGDAENIIRVRTPGKDVLTLDEASLTQVEANAVVRVLRNPDGYRSEAAGGISYTIDTRAAAGFLTILAEEWALLGLTAPSSNAGAFAFAPSLGLPRDAESGWPGSWPGGEVWPPWV